ncbi:unnamed protein product [Symbiodinium sp. CCMP2592]|nr:unnamed protein product [Symbiodinium sp. CCMP2592]
MAGTTSNAPLSLLALRWVCRVLDSPVTLFLVWTLAALSSAAVLAQHQRLAEESLVAGLPRAGPIMSAARPLLRSTATATASPMVQARLGSALDALAEMDPPARRRRALGVLLRVAQNLIEHPQDPKYMLIWKGNAVFSEALGALDVAGPAMRGLGFRETSEGKAWQFQWTKDSPAALKDAVAEIQASLRAAKGA